MVVTSTTVPVYYVRSTRSVYPATAVYRKPASGICLEVVMKPFLHESGSRKLGILNIEIVMSRLMFYTQPINYLFGFF